MTAYPYTFHRESGDGTEPFSSGSIFRASDLRDAIAKLEQVTWPDGAVLATIEVTGRSDVVVTR